MARRVRRKVYVLAVLGILLTLVGAYRKTTGGGEELLYLGISTLGAVLIYLSIARFREITSFFLSLIVLHSGVLLLFVEELEHPKLLGSIVFASGVVLVMASNFSEYLQARRQK